MLDLRPDVPLEARENLGKATPIRAAIGAVLFVIHEIAREHAPARLRNHLRRDELTDLPDGDSLAFHNPLGLRPSC